MHELLLQVSQVLGGIVSNVQRLCVRYDDDDDASDFQIE